MADYIYLLENRLSAAQQAALRKVREIARAQGLTVFLVGGAVRDLTHGSPVRDLDVAVQGNALKFKKQIELDGGVITGENTAGQSLFVEFSGGVRMEIGSTLSATYPKPGKPVLKPATIQEDLRRRDFTANAMALSLNEGSYALLMDPLNGVADIENRQLRLVSPYGFIEDPVRMVRAVRLSARLGWTMDERTQQRYDTGKEEDYIAALSDFNRGYETEEIFHEDDPLLVLRKLEEQGWMKHLFPALAVAKVNAAELEKLRDKHAKLEVRGIHADTAAASFPLLTAKLSAKDVADLKSSFVRPGFVKEIEALDGEAKELAAQWTAKTVSSPSQAWKMLMAAKPEAVLWMVYSSRSSTVQAKFESFVNEWPQARNKIPYALMQEMRITPELPVYDELVEKLFFELMDGKLGTTEEMKAFLEVYSPPAPPPVVNVRRPRTSKKDAKAKGRKKPVEILEEDEDLDDDLDSRHGDEDEDEDAGESDSEEEVDEIEEALPPVVKVKAAPVKPAPKAVAPASPPAPPVSAKTAPAKAAPAPVPAKVAAKPAPAKSAPATEAKTVAAPKKPVPARAAPAKKTTPVKKPQPVAQKVPAKKVAAKAAPAKKAVPAKKVVVVKKAAPPQKAPAKKAVAPAKKAVPAKKQPVVAKKAVKSASKKRR
ncbi:MAG TPA: CCA tRNA nucleotidyltransferase [Granulicella sp.]